MFQAKRTHHLLSAANKTSAKLVFQKNTDSALSSSHLVTNIFFFVEFSFGSVLVLFWPSLSSKSVPILV